ncbi:MAG: S8 family serine peptidase [Lachnospiraceae bacterium]
MKKHRFFKQSLSFVLVLCMLFAYAIPVHAAKGDTAATGEDVSFEQVDNSTVKSSAIQRDPFSTDTPAENFKSTDTVRVSIVLNDKSTLDAGYDSEDIASNTDAMDYRTKLKNNQKSVEKKINKATGKTLKVQWNLTLAANIISADVKYGDISKIESVSDVQEVIVETQYLPCETVDTADPDMAISSGSMTGTTAAWAKGYTGAGSRIAIIDTGLDVEHQSFDNDAFLYSLKQDASQKRIKYSSYYKSLNLLDTRSISRAMKYLNANTVSQGTYSADDLYLTEKIPFAFNYVDVNTNVSHLKDTTTEHGSHVAGIAAANRYVKTDNGFEEALDSVYVAGTAPDAQVLVMKVFGENGGAYDSDYMAAIEDAILLGCDAVNLSLGSASAGMTTSTTYQDLLDNLRKTNTVISISAGNSGAWSDNSYFGALYSDDVNYHTGGSPGTYANALTVASVDNDGMIGYTFDVAGNSYYYTETSGYTNEPLRTLASGGDAGTYDYIFIDGVGNKEDYTGMDLEGKIVFCTRGEITFSEKANNAAELGAAATIIYNNQPGTISMNLSDYMYPAPAVSIYQSDGAAIKAAGTEQTTDDGLTYYTGKITINANASVGKADSDYYTMSSFSSWGVPGDLTLKPEITAPGGNVYSVAGRNLTSSGVAGGTDQYELMSGTSMAAPQVTGMSADLIRYIEENRLFQKKMTNRALAQSLLMSTATPMVSPEGYTYSPMQQGAGLANLENAMNAATCILMDSNATASASDGKVKAELGDDPEKTGTYSFSFTMNNLTRSKQTYKLSGEFFTQELDKEYGGLFLYESTEKLNPAVTFTVNKKKTSSVTISPRKSVSVTVTIKLSSSDRKFLEDYINGAYVEGYVYAKPANGKTSAHSIPVLGYYGNWTDASMYDRGSYLEYAYGLENLPPYLYDSNGIYGNGYSVSFAGDSSEYFFGGNLYADEAEYNPERNALNNRNGDSINSVYYTLIRNAGRRSMVISDAETGEAYLSGELGEQYAAYFNDDTGSWSAAQSSIGLNWAGTDAEGNPLPEGTTVELTLTAAPEYYRTEDGTYDFSSLGDGAAFSTQLTIDNTAPELLEITKDEEQGSITCSVKDNQYIAALYLYADDGDGDAIASCAVGTPDTELTLGEGLDADVYLVQAIDYAGNASTYRVFLNEDVTEAVESVTISSETLNLVKNNTARLTAKANPKTLEDRSVIWSSDNEEIATVDENGIVTAVAAGTCTITAAAKADPEISASCEVTVIEITTELNGFVWDENGEVWLSRFQANNLPNYEKMTETSYKAPVASMAYGADGNLYAASLDTSTATSNLYTVDPETFELTQTGGSTQLFYTDLAAAPNLGGGMLLATYGPYVLLVDPATGEYAGAFNYCSNNLVGITYCGSMLNEYYDRYIDIYYLMDDKGNLYMDAFIDLDGAYYYFNGEEDGMMGGTGISCDTPYFQSLYFDGTYTYASCFNNGKNSVTLYAIDTEATGNVYKLGSFADGVWPVGGLAQLNPAEAEVPANAEKLSDAKALEDVEPKTIDQIEKIDITTHK